VTGGRRRFARTEIRGQTIRWLADVTIGGRVHHWSTIDLDVASDDGVVHYDGVLDDVSFSESMSLLAVADPARMTLTAQIVGASELLRAGRDMRQAAEVSRGVEGATYEARVPVMRGFVADPVVYEDSIEITIDAEPFEDKGSIPEATAVVDPSTWETAYVGDSEIGLPYPTIIGSPGRSLIDFDKHIAGSPGRWIRKRPNGPTWRLLIAGHEVQASQVMLVHDDFPDGLRFPVSHRTDGNGRVIAYIEGTSTTAGTVDNLGSVPHDVYYSGLRSSSLSTAQLAACNPARRDTSDIYVGWYDYTDPNNGRGVMVRGVGIREAGDVARYVLGFSTIPVDDGAWAAASPYLSQFKIDAMINDPVAPWEWLTANLLPLLPLSIVPGPWGVRPVVLRWGATADDAVAHFDETTGSVVFDAGIEVDSSNVANDFVLKYGLDVFADTHRYTCRRSGKQADTTAYATGRLVSDDPGSDFPAMPISSTTPGPGGVYWVTFEDTGALSYTYTAATRTVAITIDGGVTVTAQIRTQIDANSQLTYDDSDAYVWGVVPAVSMRQRLLLDDEGTAGDYRCAVSQAKMASDANPTGKILESSESSIVYDPNTANAVLEWRAAVYALPHRRVIVVGDCSEWEWLQLGDVVALTSDRLALTAEVAHVESREIHDDGQIIFRCLILEDPLRHGYVE
jgi:hypothetical protein